MNNERGKTEEPGVARAATGSTHPFGGEGADEYGAIWQALHACAIDEGYEGEYGVYAWMEATPRTSFTVFLVDKLHEMGYHVRRERGA